MTAADVPLFENRDWTVSPSGLEHKGTGYFIGRDLIGDRRGDGLWSWPVHIAEKLWVRPTSFAEAFTGALHAYDIPPDAELAASFAAGAEAAGRAEGFLGPAGPDTIRVGPNQAAWADEPDLPAWAAWPEGEPDQVRRCDLPSDLPSPANRGAGRGDGRASGATWAAS